MAVYRDTLEFPSGDEKWLEEDSQIRLLRAVTKGKLVVLPTDTVYGIGADPFSHSAVGRLLGAKGRDQTMPPPVLGGFCEELLSLLDFTSLEQRDTVEQLAREFWPGPLTIIAPVRPNLVGILSPSMARLPCGCRALTLRFRHCV